jgi:hypothetical protein
MIAFRKSGFVQIVGEVNVFDSIEKSLRRAGEIVGAIEQAS